MTIKKPVTEENWRDVLRRQEEKIDFLIRQVDRLNRTINPPVWKKIVHWVWRHWFTLVMLCIIGFIAWEAREAFLSLQEKIEEISNIPTHAKESLWDAFERVKFW